MYELGTEEETYSMMVITVLTCTSPPSVQFRSSILCVIQVKKLEVNTRAKWVSLFTARKSAIEDATTSRSSIVDYRFLDTITMSISFCSLFLS